MRPTFQLIKFSYLLFTILKIILTTLAYCLKFTFMQASLLYTWGEYLKRKLAYGTFPPLIDLESHVEGQKSTVHRAWWTVDEVYIPICISSCHWVACAIHFHHRRIIVYGSTPFAYTDQAIKGVMAPWCELIPYLLRDVGFYSMYTEIDDIDKPFTYVRVVNGLPSLTAIGGLWGFHLHVYVLLKVR